MTRHRADRREMILSHIREHVATFGYPPTFREIGAAVGLSSSSAVAHQIGVLRKAGRLNVASYQSRSMSIPNEPPKGLTADRLELAYCLSSHGLRPPKVRPCKRHRMVAEWFAEIVIPKALALP